MTYSSSSPVVTTTFVILCFNKHRLPQVHLEMAVKTGRERNKCGLSLQCFNAVGWVTGRASDL